jgi:glycosyltransferase involved in cell wall biosynthesis
LHTNEPQSRPAAEIAQSRSITVGSEDGWRDAGWVQRLSDLVDAVRWPRNADLPRLAGLAGLLAAALPPIRPTRWTPDTAANGLFLHHEPAIFTCPVVGEPFGPARYFARRYPSVPFIVLATLWWSQEDPLEARALAIAYRRFRRDHPACRLIILANTPAEEDRLRRLGVEVQFAPQNIFVDEDLFFPLPGRPRTFDAIYNAQLAPYKRHALARDIGRCAYVTFFPGKYPERTRSIRTRAFLERLPQGHSVLNPIEGDRLMPLPHTAVNAAYAGAHVGLCLSRTEGAMYASMEYLMAGLPVVSTPSRGGRDLFFHPDTTIIARDDPREIRQAVEALKARAVPPEVVRATTLRLVQRERERFNAFVERLSGVARAGTDPRWSFAFRHKLGFHEPTIGGLERDFRAGRDGRPTAAP